MTELWRRACGCLLTAGMVNPAMAQTSVPRETEGWHLPALRSDDGDVTGRLGGRLHFDLVKFDDDGRMRDNASGWQVRRAWVNLIGEIYGFDYRISVDNADDEHSYKSFYIRHKLGPGVLTVGQFKPAFSLDDSISSDDISLMDRAYVGTQLAPLFRLGVAYIGSTAGKDATYAASLYSLNDIDGVRANGDGKTLRLTWAPVHDEERVLHVGLSLAKEHYASSSNADLPPSMTALPAGPKSRRSRLRLIRIQDGLPVDADKYDLELAGRAGPWSLQGEYGGAVYGDGVQRAVVHASYLQLSYFLSGEGRPYNADTARFDTVQAPAWELAVRYDHVDANQRQWGMSPSSDLAVDNWTMGVNWYVNANLRLMINLIDGHERNQLNDAVLDHTRALTGRLQFIF